MCEVGDSTAKVVNSEQITTHSSLEIKARALVILPQRQLILSKSQHALTLRRKAKVGDSTAKVVNSEQITTIGQHAQYKYQLVILPQRQLILSKSQLLPVYFGLVAVGDSTAKVVNSEQITTIKLWAEKHLELVILPQRQLILSKSQLKQTLMDISLCW